MQFFCQWQRPVSKQFIEHDLHYIKGKQKDLIFTEPCLEGWPSQCPFLSLSVQSLSRVWLFVNPWPAAWQASLSIIRVYSNSSIESVMPSNHLILCHPLLLLPSIFPSSRVFSDESVLRIRWQKYWSFSFSISLSSEYSGLISFRMDWLDLLAVQGTLKSLLQHHSSKASILRHSAFFIGQLSHPYMTTGKTIALTRWTFVACLKACNSLFSPSTLHTNESAPVSTYTHTYMHVHTPPAALHPK